MDADFSRAADLLKVVRKGVVDLGHQIVESRLPSLADARHLPRQLVTLALGRLHLFAQLFDLATAFLKVADHVRVSCVYELELGLLRLDLVIDFSHRLLARDLLEVLSAVGMSMAGFNDGALGPFCCFSLASPVFFEPLNGSLLLIDFAGDSHILIFEPKQVRLGLDLADLGFNDSLVCVSYRCDAGMVLQDCPGFAHYGLVKLDLEFDDLSPHVLEFASFAVSCAMLIF